MLSTATSIDIVVITVQIDIPANREFAIPDAMVDCLCSIYFVVVVFSTDTRYSAQGNIQCHIKQPNHDENTRKSTNQGSTSFSPRNLTEELISNI